MRNKPVLRTDAIFSLRHAISSAMAEAIETMDIPFQSCINCDFFNKEAEICKIVNRRPPAQVIVFGCKSWYNNKDEIPF